MPQTSLLDHSAHLHFFFGAKRFKLVDEVIKLEFGIQAMRPILHPLHQDSQIISLEGHKRQMSKGNCPPEPKRDARQGLSVQNLVLELQES